MKTKLKSSISLIVVCASFLLLAISCKKDSDNDPPVIKDGDGNIYTSVTIGTQFWLKENLKTTKYIDGGEIPLVTDNTQWSALTSPGFCWYDNNQSTYKDTYGGLYNWYAVNTMKLCPAGWHVPTDAEWKVLEIFLGMSAAEADLTSFRGTAEGGKVKEVGTAHWNSPNEGATNSSGFTALPGGNRYSEFAGIKVNGVWWSSTEISGSAFWRALYFDRATISRYDDIKRLGASVRCIKD